MRPIFKTVTDIANYFDAAPLRAFERIEEAAEAAYLLGKTHTMANVGFNGLESPASPIMPMVPKAAQQAKMLPPPTGDLSRVTVHNLYWKDQTIDVDGYTFVGCLFENCVLRTRWGGIRPAYKLDNCASSGDTRIEVVTPETTANRTSQAKD